MQKNTKKKLFNKKTSFKGSFLKNEEFVNFDLKEKYINEIEKDYLEEKLKLNNFIDYFIDLYEKEKAEIFLKIGCAYFDEKTKIKTEEIEVFKNIFKEFSNKFKEEENQLLEKTKLYINDFLVDKLNFKKDSFKTFIQLKENKQYFINIETNVNLTKEQIKEIENFFIVKVKIELTNIKFLNIENQNNLQKYIFSCELVC